MTKRRSNTSNPHPGMTVFLSRTGRFHTSLPCAGRLTHQPRILRVVAGRHDPCGNCVGRGVLEVVDDILDERESENDGDE